MAWTAFLYGREYVAVVRRQGILPFFLANCEKMWYNGKNVYSFSELCRLYV